MTKTSITEEFLSDRVDPSTSDKIETGKWYSGFSKVYDYAMENKLPFIGVWTNGDQCYYCRKLEKCLMTEKFKTWMKDSGCIFWFGCNLDKSEDDKLRGTGYYWGWDNKTVKSYPFVRFYWTDGTDEVNRSDSGNKWDGTKEGDDGAQNVIDGMNRLLDEVHSHDITSSPSVLKIRTNPEWSVEEVEEFRKSIKDNGGYCPCSPDQTPDTKCMCKWFREQTTEGNCHCGLYNKYYA